MEQEGNGANEKRTEGWKRNESQPNLRSWRGGGRFGKAWDTGERTNSTNAEDRAKTWMKERGDEHRRRGERNDPGEREERRG